MVFYKCLVCYRTSWYFTLSLPSNPIKHHQTPTKCPFSLIPPTYPNNVRRRDWLCRLVSFLTKQKQKKIFFSISYILLQLLLIAISPQPSSIPIQPIEFSLRCNACYGATPNPKQYLTMNHKQSFRGFQHRRIKSFRKWNYIMTSRNPYTKSTFYHFIQPYKFHHKIE